MSYLGISFYFLPHCRLRSACEQRNRKKTFQTIKQQQNTGWRRPIGCLICTGHFPQKSPGRTATERFSAQLPRAQWSGPELSEFSKRGVYCTYREGSVFSPLCPHSAGPIQGARGNCTLKRSVAARPDGLGWKIINQCTYYSYTTTV